MNKRILIFSLITFLIFIIFNVSYSSDVVMDWNNNNNNLSFNGDRNSVTGSENTISNSILPSENSTVNDNTIYSSDSDVSEQDTLEENTSSDIQEPTVTTTTEYENSGDLSITNMINIVLIVVGVVLILLGIAIIIRLK